MKLTSQIRPPFAPVGRRSEKIDLADLKQHTGPISGRRVTCVMAACRTEKPPAPPSHSARRGPEAESRVRSAYPCLFCRPLSLKNHRSKSPLPNQKWSVRTKSYGAIAHLVCSVIKTKDTRVVLIVSFAGEIGDFVARKCWSNDAKQHARQYIDILSHTLPQVCAR
jgi:hypothetical protein